MNNSSKNNYISLQEATKFCEYTQEYLSLRARQGKLKSVKFGRNWVTKREWLEEYLKKVEEYNNQIAIKKLKRVEPPKELEKVLEPLPRLVPKFRLAPTPILLLVVGVLLIGGIVFGQESFKNVYQDLDPYVTKISEAVDESFALISTFASFGSSVSDLAAKEIFAEAKNFYGQIPAYTYILGAGVEESLANVNYQAAEVGGLLKEYFQWISQNYFAANDFVEEKISNIARSVLATSKGFVLGIKGGYFAANDFVEEKLSDYGDRISIIGQRIVKGYLSANEFVEEKLSQGYQAVTQPFVRGYQFVTQPWRVMVVVPEKVVTEKIIEKEIVKEVEVERVTRIEPIKEITRETVVTKIDEEELAKLKTQMAEFTLWGADIENLREITKKLQATPTYTPAPSAPIYIGYQGIQVGGTGTFASLGVSGSAGIGDLGVGGSTSLGSSSAIP